MGYDTNGRPAVYSLPSRQNTDGSTQEGQRKQLQFYIWMQERAIELMPLGVETVTVMIDYTDRSQGPSFGTASVRFFVTVFLDYLPSAVSLTAILTDLAFTGDMYVSLFRYPFAPPFPPGFTFDLLQDAILLAKPLP